MCNKLEGLKETLLGEKKWLRVPEATYAPSPRDKAAEREAAAAGRRRQADATSHRGSVSELASKAEEPWHSEGIWSHEIG